MFRKIHSNRDPEITIWKALQEEFGGYFIKLVNRFGKACLSYPKFLFGVMVVLLAGSGILSFTVFRYPAKGAASIAAQPNPHPLKSPPSLNDGFSRILETGSALKQTLGLKQQVESILAKSQLDHRDSLRLGAALDSLQHLQQQIQ